MRVCVNTLECMHVRAQTHVHTLTHAHTHARQELVMDIDIGSQKRLGNEEGPEAGSWGRKRRRRNGRKRRRKAD